MRAGPMGDDNPAVGRKGGRGNAAVGLDRPARSLTARTTDVMRLSYGDSASPQLP